MLINEVNTGGETLVLESPFVRICSGAKILQSEITGNLTIDTNSCINRSTIEQFFGLGCFSYVANCHIGRFCTFGARVSVGAFSHPTDWLSIHEIQYRDTSGIYGQTIIGNGINIAPFNEATMIGCDVWIGDNACVKTGVTLGHGSIVGLGAVVVADVPPYAIVGGNPARILRYRFNESTIEKLLFLRWWDFSLSELSGIDFSDVESSCNFLSKLRDKMT
jgi:acetyltransferase-like isoleucine patch superfamily enzyme